jgi:hypothetical protein
MANSVELRSKQLPRKHPGPDSGMPQALENANGDSQRAMDSCVEKVLPLH